MSSLTPDAALDDVVSVSGASQSTYPESGPGLATPSSSSVVSGPDLVRVFVQLPNGTKFLVPVPQISTIYELHTQALRRARRFGTDGTLENTFLETTGPDQVALFLDDSLLDVMDLTANNTFSLRMLVDQPPTPDEGTSTSVAAKAATPSSSQNTVAPGPSRGENSMVYIRWITLEAALDNSRLRKVPIDQSPIPSDTTLNDLYTTSINRLCGTSPLGSCTNPRKLNLFLWECKLHALNNPATLNDLGLTGSRRAPLNIFVEFTGPERRLSLNHLAFGKTPKTLWNFDSTNRGMCTFVTSLQILFEEIDRKKCTLESIVDILWQLTHFPPLLLAFKSLHRLGLGEVAPASHLLLVASAFHAICRRVAPSELCPSSENALEAARQIIYGIYCMSSDPTVLRGNADQFVHQVQIKEKGDGEPTPEFLPFKEVSMPLAPGAGPLKKTFLVSTEEENSALCRVLGLAIHENASSPWDYYFRSPNGEKDLLGHKIVGLLRPEDLENLMKTTDDMGAFRMVSPLELGGCLVAELPVITLSATGYVSRYEHDDIECGERCFITWNAIDKAVKQEGHPGQDISQKLEPILQERKKTRNWELDAWSGWTKAADFGVPDEAIVICVDVSGSMDTAMPHNWVPNKSNVGLNPSRLTEVKEFFKNQAVRISALNLSTHLGLVTFAGPDSVEINQPLTPLHLNFSNQLDNIHASGPTAMFDALNTASGMLQDLKSRHPKTKCRIILLTDGEDNRSSIPASDASMLLYKNDIVLDAIVIGTNETRDLFKIAKHTGGYAFKPLTQQALFQIFLLETVCDIRTRPEIDRVPWESDWCSFQPKAPDMSDLYDIPPCKPHPNVDDYFVALADSERFLSRISKKSRWSAASISSASTNLSNASTMTASAGGISRILLHEIKAMIDHPHQYLDIYVSQSNMGFWKVIMEGPPDSPYSKGTYLLYVEIGPEFPRKPPSARFITPMLHPNITKHGRVCHPIFDREWSPATHVFEVLQQLYGILMSLEVRDAVDPLSALRFWSDAEEGRREVEKYVARFAQRSRKLYRQDIISGVSTVSGSSGNTPSSTSSSYAGSVSSDATLVSSRPPTFQSNIQNWVQNSSSRPPSYRTTGSGSVRSRFSLSSGSTLSRHLANQRLPSHPKPPSGTDNQGVGNAGGAQNAGSGETGAAPMEGVTSSSSVVSGEGGNDSDTVSIATSSGSRGSRRASFFAKLRNAGNRG